MKGKQRLVLLAVVVLAVVAVAALVRYPRSKRAQTVAANTEINATGRTSATPDEVKALESWGLKPADLPASARGAQLQQGSGELTDYTLAQGDATAAKAFADSGRVDGFSQIWINTTPQGQTQRQLQSQFRVYFDLYSSPAQAMSVIDKPYDVSGGGALPKSSTDPKLGDASRMFSASSSGAGGLQTWAIRWVRGRSVLSVDGIAPSGQLTQDDVMNLAKTIDARAKQTSIK
jgi:hypothetical protein